MLEKGTKTENLVLKGGSRKFTQPLIICPSGVHLSPYLTENVDRSLFSSQSPIIPIQELSRASWTFWLNA